MSQDSFTPVTFSPEERRSIAQALVAGENVPLCPRCGTGLEVEKSTRSAGSNQASAFRVQCKPCRRMAFITDFE